MALPDFTEARKQSLLKYLKYHTSAELRFDDTSRKLYATDASHYRIQPLGVVIPRTPEDLTAVVQIAGELTLPITARGGGTSLSGQSIGPGIVIDCSKYLDRVGEFNPETRSVTVQPGVVLDRLNRHLAGTGWMFGPDVATANRATLGGMLGNNSAGAHSVVYGKTVDHVRSLNVILADGRTTTLGYHDESSWNARCARHDAEGDLYRSIDAIARENAAEIEARFPKILRRVSGYNLPGIASRSLAPLVIGSEGTLAVIAEAELNLVPRPNHRGLLVPHFDSLIPSLDCLAICLEMQPSAVELMDTMLIDLARQQRSLSKTMAAIEGRPAALLMVEFTGDTEAEVADRVGKLARRLQSAPGLTACVPALDAAIRDPLWNLRSSAVPLLYGMPGDRKPVTFVEDCAVAPERLPEFAERFRGIIRAHGTEGTFYGHASVGCLHIRPVLNLHDPADVVTMRAIMEDVTDLVLEFNGSLSGEHGDGLVRSEWNRKMFGPQIYEAFRQVKRAFDPENVLNPGKVVDAPAMEENLRFTPGAPVPTLPTVFDYEAQGGFFRSIELCNGAGVCRKTQGGAMCPSYRATMDERDTTRARANALRHALDTVPSAVPLAEKWIAPVMDLCLSCKACKSECPSNVDLAKLKSEWQHAYYAKRTRPMGHYLAKNIHTASPWASNAAGVLNWLGRQGFARSILESLGGIDRRRSLPEWHRNHFRRWFLKHDRPPHPQPLSRQGRGGPEKKVVLLDDCFTTFQEPQIGQAAVRLLERAGYSVELAGICCGRAMISKGFLKEAQLLAQQGVRKLSWYAAEGVPVLGLEPSCLLTLSDEWPELVPSPQAKAVAANAELVEGWFAKKVRSGEIVYTPKAPAKPMAFHGHCHQKALVGVSGSVDALKLLPNAEVAALDAGCCGMAGMFGYEKEHYDISVRIANLELLPALAKRPEATVVATGTSCRHQIRDLCGRTALHPVEVLEALAGKE
jgi:FAD/FMN-containing dehydrogenase/Fe-S oxidoreductase